ncbi:MAG: plasmid mobilization relaxosome protein MobC, partial [Gemmiger sp.]|uniref:plasmid mobilization relaxosome protein MobC n=1 Tax=Gemmiger sp. TaxID=2049027 RepID=UPI002E780B32
LAAQSGLSREKLLRALIMGETIRQRPCTHHEDLLRKVSGLCNNANQVAHRANSTGVAGQESVDKMIRISQEIWKEVKSQW